jgi:para-nitrobenzyl esterase
LRAKTAQELLDAAWRGDQFRFGADVDGAFLPEGMRAIYAARKQNRVSLLAGWNADEGGYQSVLKDGLITPENFVKMAGEQFGDKADDFLKLYPAQTAEEIKRAAGDLAGDQFIAFSTWKWIEEHSSTAKQPIYRYEFDNALPQPAGQESRGAYHSAEIEFVFGDLASKKLPWRPEDWKVSDLMMNYWSNFAKTGNPNGPGLPKWPVYQAKSHYQVMHLSADPKAESDKHRARYEFLDKLDSKK